MTYTLLPDTPVAVADLTSLQAAGAVTEGTLYALTWRNMTYKC